MTFSHPEIDRVFDTTTGRIPTLVIEDPGFLYRLLSDIQSQTEGLNGECVVALTNAPVSMARYAELLTSFVPFEINRKPLITKILTALEESSLSPVLYERTMRLLADVENYLYDLAFDYPCDIRFTKVTIPAILKASGLELREEYPSLAEKVLDFMELVTAFEHEKLFITVNFRSFVPQDQVAAFMDSVLAHGYHLLMIESREYTRLPMEHRTVIDADLCEIGD